MLSRRRRTDLATSSGSRVSRADHAPVSESPQLPAPQIAHGRAYVGRVFVLASLTMGVASVSGGALAGDSPATNSPEAAPQPAWTRMKALDEERPPRSETPPQRESYETELACAYVATPVLGFGLPLAFGAADSPLPGWGFALAVVLASTPVPLTHLLNDRPGRALGTFVLTPALFFGGVLVGTFVALAIISATMTHDTAEEQEDGALAHGTTALGFGIATGILAVGIWAVVDVLDARAPSVRSSRPRALAQLRIGVAPHAGGAAAVLAGRF